MHSIMVDFAFVHDLAAGYQDLVVADKLRATLALGSTDGKANKAFRFPGTIAASGSVTIDFTALGDAAGGNVTLDEVYGLVVWIATAGATATFAKGASNGWTGLGSDWSVPMTGQQPFLYACSDGRSVDSSHKTVTLTNTGGSSMDAVIYVLGRKA